MKVFVTGGTGFLGGHLVKRLLRQGDITVKALARDKDKADYMKKLGAEPVIGDIADRNSLKGALKGCDILYQLGNISKWWLPDKTLYYKVNVEGTKNILLEALNEGVKKVVYTSSLAAIRQPDGKITTEEMEFGGNFESDYGRSKFLAEQEALKIYRESGLPVMILNPGVIIGPGDTKTFGRTLIELLNGKLKVIAFEESIAPLVYIDDAVEAHILAAEKGRPGERYIIVGNNVKIGDVFKLTSKIAGVPLPQKRIGPFTAKLIAHLLELRARLTGKPPKFAVDGVREMTAGAAGSNKKAKEELGLEFTPFEEAVRKTIVWYKENGYVS